MANKRVSELVQITAAELSPSDLLLLADVAPNPESKKLTLTELSSYLLSGGNLSGSLFGTSSWAEKAVSASWAPPQASSSYAAIAALALSAITASHALTALSASWSLSGSYVITASYALTSSVQLIYSSAFADYARSASYLIYSPLVGNGTASYAISSSYATQSFFAFSASYATASAYAYTASFMYTASSAVTASNAITASFSLVTGTANTATYATVAGTAGTANNGIQDKQSAISVEKQTGNSITETSPDNIIDLVVTMSVTNDAPTYLVNLSVAVGGVTGISLWRSASIGGDVALINTIGISSSSLDSVDTICTSYLDTPTALQGETVYYIARAYNDDGDYYINRSFNGTKFGTSSLTVIEF